MRVKAFKIRTCDIPLRFEFRQASNARISSQGLLVEVVTENGIIGYGECLPREYVSGETLSQVTLAVKYGARHFVGSTFTRFKDILTFMEALSVQWEKMGLPTACARCAIELALLDAWGRETGAPLAALFSNTLPDNPEIKYSGVIAGSNEHQNDLILDFVSAMKMDQIKLKVGRDHEAELRMVLKIRSRLGPAAGIRVDVNGAWCVDAALRNIPDFVDAGVNTFEQPLGRFDREGYLKLSSETGDFADIWVDESVCSLAEAQWFIHHGAADGINLKISKNGGLFNCMEIVRMAREKNVRCQLGAQVGETSLLTAAGRILSALAGDLVYHEGAVGKYLLEYDIVDPPLEFSTQGRASLHAFTVNPGLGIRVDPEAVSRLNLLYGIDERGAVDHT